MSQTRQIIAVLTALFIATAAAVMLTDSSDAVDTVSIGNFNCTGFSDNSDGTLSVTVNVNGGDASLMFIVTEGSETVSSASAIIKDGESQVVGITFRLGTGEHSLVVTAAGTWIDDGGNPIGDIASADISGSGSVVSVNVEPSFWSGWVPYVALIFVGLVVVLMLYIWNRNRPKTKTISFNDLEEGKVAAPAPAADTGRKKYEAGGNSAPGKSTERIKYTSDRRK